MTHQQSCFISARKILMRGVLSLYICAVLLQPVPAHATFSVTDLARGALITSGWEEEATAWASLTQALNLQIQKLTKLDQTLTKEFQKYSDLLREIAADITEAVQVVNKSEVKVNQSLVDSKAINARHAATLQTAADNTEPTHEYLCKRIKAGQLSVTIENAEREGTHFIINDVLSLGRRAKEDANGPLQVALQRKYMVDGKYVNPVSGDTEATDASKKTTDGLPLAGMEERTAEIGQRLVKSKISGSGTGRTLAPATNDQRAYTQKIMNIVLARGSHTTALWGKNMMTPIGRLQRSLKNHALAVTAVLVRQPAAVIEFTTRPNCADASSEALCKKQEEQCKAATDGLIKGSIVSSCTEGLSPYESLLIEQLMCKSKQHAVLQAAAGASFGEQMQTIQLCDMAWGSLMDLVQLKESIQGRAIMAMGQLGALEGAVNALGSGAYTAQVEEETNSLRRYTASLQEEVQDTKIVPISAVPMGRILSADEIQWPEVIGQ